MVINDNRNLIIPNAIGVPDVDRDIFIEGLMNYIKLVDEKEYSSSYAEIQDALIFGNTNHINEDLTKAFGNLIYHCGVQFTAEIYDFFGGNIAEYSDIVGVKQNMYGVNYLGFAASEYECKPIFGAIYFNGKELCAYIPKYGNPYNLESERTLGLDEDEDYDYLSNYSCDDIDDITVDTSMLMEDLNEAFYLAGNFNGQIVPPAHYKVHSSTNNASSSSSSTSSSSAPSNNMSLTDILYKLFSEKQYAAISAFKTSLLNQGFMAYDKKLCFTAARLANKDDMLKDIYNYIWQFDENGNDVYRFIECKKIALFIKKYKYRFEGGM